jgi:hypothetical protein
MNKKNYYLSVFFIFFHYCVLAQAILPDSVIATNSFIDTIKRNYNNESTYLPNLDTINITAKIPIRLHIIKNVFGNSGVNPIDVFNSIKIANSYFKTIGIQFFIDSVDYINDYNYSYINSKESLFELQSQFTVLNRINLYMVDNIKIDGGRTYGFTYFPDMKDKNYIYLNKDYANGKYLTTMLGHFMGLFSTHESTGDAELVNETNCATSGDYICDTFADPNLRDQVDSTCNYTDNKRDSSGSYYIPSVANIMSNTRDECKCIFTPLQYVRMYYYYLKYRQRLK